MAGPDFVLGGGHNYPEELYSYGGLALLEGSSSSSPDDGGFRVGVATAVAAANCATVSPEAATSIYTW